MSTNSKFQDMIAQAKKIVDSFNETPGVEKIDFEAFQTGLATLGGTDAEALKEIELADLIGLGLPKLRAKQVLQIFQQKDAGTTASKPRRINKHNAHDAETAELVAVYNPRRPTTPAAEELKKRSKDRPFVVFDDQGGVHRQLTTQLLEELERGEPVREDITAGGGRIATVYRVGELPPETVDMHPLYEGQALRSDGTCSQSINWKDGISLPVRQLVYLAVHKTHELTVRDVDHEHDIHSKMKGEDAMEKLQQRYRKAARLFGELRDAQNLPSLRMPRDGSGSRKGSHPFHQDGDGHRQY